MCNFLSAVVMENGEILCNPRGTDSHEDLLKAANVRDGLAQQGRFVRIEFLPPKDYTRIFDTSTWRLVVDQKDIPSWFDKARVRSSMVAIVEGMFVQEDRDLLSGGCWILGKDICIKTVKDARIFKMLGSSKIDEMRGSSKVSEMYHTSEVGDIFDTSEIGEMFDTSKVDGMYDSSKVGRMSDSSEIGEMWGSSKVEWMYDSSKVGEMHNSSKVGGIYGLSKIGEMWGLSKVGEM